MRNVRRPGARFRTVVAIAALTAIAAGAQEKSAPPETAALKDAARSPAAPLGSAIPEAVVLETFPNTWHSSTIGFDYNPDTEHLFYAHEDSAVDPATLWDVDFAPPHASGPSYNLSALNPGFPVSLNDRDGVAYDPVAGTYFLSDFQGDLAVRDDNIVEISAAGTILNAWELDGASNDSSDATNVNTVIDIAIVPGTPNRYFVAAAEGTGLIREIALTRSGLWIPATWNTVATCTVPDIGDAVALDYDEESGLLFVASFNSEVVSVVDLSCNVVFQFSCDGPGAFHTGIAFIEGATPPQVWVTDFNSESTTRCQIPSITLASTLSGDGSCGSGSNFDAYLGDPVTYCHTVTNVTDVSPVPEVTYTEHDLVDDAFGTILDDAAQNLAPGGSFQVLVDGVAVGNFVNEATWTASGPGGEAEATSTTTLSALPSAPELCTTFDSTDVPVAIGPDPGTWTSDLTIAAPDGTSIYDVNVTVTLTHTWDSDLDLTLISPLGTPFVLSSGNGGSGDDYAGTIFDSHAGTPIEAGVPPFTGRFSPEQSLAPLSGTSSAGLWTLQIVDTAFADGGTLTAWSLEICDAPEPAIELVATVGTVAGSCATTPSIALLESDPPTTVYYCYTATNSGNYQLPIHNLSDSVAGVVLDGEIYDLDPGESVSTVDLGIEVSAVVSETEVRKAVWEGEIPGVLQGVDGATATVWVLPAEIFSDGLESGGTGAWSGTAPLH